MDKLTLFAQWQFRAPENIVIVGAGGAIGAAISRQLKHAYPNCRLIPVCHQSASLVANSISIDFRDEASINLAAKHIMQRSLTLDAIINCSGYLHGKSSRPEKSLAMLSQQSLRELMDINAYGPILLARAMQHSFKHPHYSLFASLSARVGSISDNELGGWYSYRASKAAHNMLMKTLSIEWKRTLPHTIVAMLQPGTVDSALSKPFQRNVANLLQPEQSAAGLINAIGSLTPADSGVFIDWQANRIPF